jgi:septal ring factor EnvC (AmiA/AmiB activator)
VSTQQLVVQFLLKNWKGILIVVLSLVVMGKMRYDYKQMQAAYEASEQSLQAQIAGLQEIHKQQIADMEESLQVYKDTLDQIERDYQESQEELLEVIESRKEEYGRQFSQDPDELAETIMYMYGFDYVP